MKQTTVEWLVEQLDGERHLTENEIKRLIQQAKEYLKGFRDGKEWQRKNEQLTFKSE